MVFEYLQFPKREVLKSILPKSSQRDYIPYSRKKAIID